MKNRLFFYFGVILSGYVTLLPAQISLQRWTISSFGNSLKQQGIYLSQTAGQPSNTAKFSNRLILSQGFQQSYLWTRSVSLSPENEIQCNIFPNPFATYFFISLNRWEKNMVFQLITPQGKQLKTLPVTSTGFRVDARDLPFGVYLLALYRNGQLLSLQRIVKFTR